MDVVVTVPWNRWHEWCEEGDLPGQPWSGYFSYFIVPARPDVQPGDRVYVVCRGQVRGYAPLARLGSENLRDGRLRYALIREGGAVAVTIPERVNGFRGFRYRWWPREVEVEFPDWRVLGVR